MEARQSQPLKSNSTWLDKQGEKFEAYRFGWMAMFITMQSCLGSVACMYILQTKASDVWLMLCAMVTMGCNAVLIAQAPPKWCLVSFYLSMLVNALLVIILNLL